MKKTYTFETEELDCLLKCFKTTEWAHNAGKNRHDNRSFKITKTEDSYEFNCQNGDSPLMLTPLNLLECIHSFHKIIFQELIIQKQLTN